MTVVHYWVEENGPDGYRVTGEVPDALLPLHLLAHQEVGPEDPQGHFLGLSATCLRTGRPLTISRVTSREWRVEGASGGIRFSYEVRLPSPQDFSAYLRGWRDRGGAFFLGLTLFLTLADQEARYQLGFREQTFSSCPEQDGKFRLKGRRSLFLSAFGQGRYKPLEVQNGRHRLLLLREESAPGEWEALLPHFSVMLGQLLDLFGGAPFERLTFFLFASRTRDQEGMGSGLALPAGVLLTFPRQSHPPNDPRHLWLALHEILHQWLGMDLKAKDPGLEWFFEGFTCFFTLTLLREGGWAEAAYEQTVVAHNRAAYLAAARDLMRPDSSTSPGATEFNYLFHGGFFLARLWDQDLRQLHPRGLAAWMRKFYETYRGESFDTAALLAALQATAPGGRLPVYFADFINRKKFLPV